MIDGLAIEIVDPGHPSALRLIAELDAFQSAMYPPESNHLDSVQTLRANNVRFLGAFLDLDMVACGAIKLAADYAEVKRVYVPPRHRNKGIARAMMVELENQARKAARQHLFLETGVHQPEALGLYQSLGYRRCPPFGDYAEDPNSVFMHKAIGA